MKKLSKYFIFIFFMLLACNISVNAETCYYNFNGLSPSKDAANDALFKVEISGEGEAGSTAIGELISPISAVSNGSEEIQNWGNDFNGKVINAQEWYINNNEKCLPYAIFYTNGGGFEFDQMYLTDYEGASNPDPYFDGSDSNRRHVHIFKLIDENADTSVKRTCDYDFFTIKYNVNNQVVGVDSKTKLNYFATTEMDLSSNSVDKCPTIYSCDRNNITGTLGSSNLYDNYSYLFYSDYSTWNIDQDKCTILNAKENSSNVSICQKYGIIMYGDSTIKIDGMKDQWDKYKECLENNNAACVAEEMSNYRTKKDTLKTWCNATVSNNNYDNPCVKKCLDLNKDIAALENGDDGNEEDSDCRLIAWILNIIRWIKYIIPAIVVILGILDFIKALSSDKDDEMKKAQSRFVKRLIAAALIFIVPLILEFALDKMGFGKYINSCLK